MHLTVGGVGIAGRSGTDGTVGAPGTAGASGTAETMDMVGSSSAASVRVTRPAPKPVARQAMITRTVRKRRRRAGSRSLRAVSQQHSATGGKAIRTPAVHGMFPHLLDLPSR